MGIEKDFPGTIGSAIEEANRQAREFDPSKLKRAYGFNQTCIQFPSPDEAAAQILKRQSRVSIKQLASLPTEAVLQTYSFLQQTIVSDYGLWDPDNPYTDCDDTSGIKHPDSVAYDIIVELQKLCRVELGPHRRKAIEHTKRRHNERC